MIGRRDVSDAVLARRCLPLQGFLDIPRSRGEIAGWASGRGISPGRLRSMLRFLETQDTGGVFDPGAFTDEPAAAMWRRHR